MSGLDIAMYTINQYSTHFQILEYTALFQINIKMQFFPPNVKHALKLLRSFEPMPVSQEYKSVLFEL